MRLINRAATRFPAGSIRRALRLGGNTRNILILGAGADGRRLAEVLQDRPEPGCQLLGFIDRVKAPGVIGPPERIDQIIARHAVDEIMIALPLREFYAEIDQIIRIAEEQGIVVSIRAELIDQRLARARVERVDRAPVITLHPAPAINCRSSCKRLIDITGATTALILFAPLMLLIAALIRITSPGGALFVQERIGLHKQRFRMFKFRTMVSGAEARIKELESLNEAVGPVFKLRHDPRVTPLGRFLRRTSLDELPQLFNVLRGELSLVGPRPLPVRDFERFDEYWYNRRFSVKPGMTCIWQVSGRSQTSFERWIKQDLEYIDNWSLALDLKLLFKTIPAVLRGTGAM